MSFPSSQHTSSLGLAIGTDGLGMVPYLLGVDGGGTGCRVVLADRHGTELARVSGEAAALGLGHGRAWAAIEAACDAAFIQAGLSRQGCFDARACVMACGLAGVHHPQWRAEFVAHAPPLAALLLDSDAYTTLLGAHGGAPGVVIAVGTGSIGAVLEPHGKYRTVGGYGFPASDEASGAWLGLRAMKYAQHALDGRAARDEFALALYRATGIDGHESLVEWLAAARQADYARLAPVVLSYREHQFVAQCLVRAAEEIGRMIAALDPQAALPVALAGGLAPALREWLPAPYKNRLRSPEGDSASGALLLAKRYAQSR
jgi:glucosamine kinase